MLRKASEASIEPVPASGAPPGSGPQGLPRLALLAEATELLAAASNEWGALERLATLTVPTLADWCAIDLVDHVGHIRRAAVVHAAEGKIESVRRLQERYPLERNGDFGVAKALETGISELFATIPAELLRAAAVDAEHERLIKDLRMRSVMIVPLIARGHSLGAITLVTAESGRTYTKGDLELAEAIALRAALAVDRCRLSDEVRESERRFESLVDSLNAIVWEADADTMQPFYVSRQVENVLGHPPERFIKDDGFWEAVIHPGNRDDVLRERRKASAERRRYDIEYRAITADGRVLWLREMGTSVDEPSGPHLRGFILDVSSRVHATTHLTESRERLSFLAEASALLTSSLNHRAVLERLASLVVPRIADWCAIDVAEEDGRLRRVAVVHKDLDRADAARQLKELPPDEVHVRVIRRVLQTHQPLLDVDGSAVCSTEDPLRRKLLEELGVGSAIVLPLMARGRTVGAIKLVRLPGKVQYAPEDLAFAEDLARRAALAVDNARLFQDRSHVARTLQRSLLPPHLPRIPGLEVAARYHAAGEGIEVGGDFYDVFRTAKDDWAILIGDVCGKGADAAALTALARYTVRAAAMQARKPSRVLTQLNEALVSSSTPEHGLDVRFCTVAYVRLRPIEAGARVTVTAGGHPPPLIVRRNGTIEPACRPGTVIGVVPDLSLTDRSSKLGPGDALVLYTDGLTEARNEDGYLGEVGLRTLLAECAGRTASGMAETLERAVLDFQGGKPRDDVAIIVVRIPS